MSSDSEERQPTNQRTRKVALDILVAVSAVLIPSALGLFGVYLCYLFELGYCHYYEIPRQLIKFEVSDVIMALAKVIAIACSLLFLLAMTFRFEAPFRVHDDKDAISVAVSCGLLYVVWRGFLIDFVLVSALALITANIVAIVAQRYRALSMKRAIGSIVMQLGVAAIVVYIAFRTDPYVGILIGLTQLVAFAAAGIRVIKLRPDVNESTPLNVSRFSIRKLAIAALVVIVASLPFAYAGGHGKASSTERFLCAKDFPDYVLAAIYGDNMIFCQFTREANGANLTGRLRIQSKSAVADKNLFWQDLGTLKKVARQPTGS